MLFEPQIADDLLKSLNQLIHETKNLTLQVLYYTHLIDKVEADLKGGAEFVSKLGLWGNIASTPYDKIA